MTKPSSEKLAPRPGKEEGELTASEDDDQPFYSVATPACPLVGRMSVPSANNSTRRNQAGNSVSSNNSLDVRPTTLIRPSSQKSEKKQVSFNSANPAKNKPVGANRNLVISFSDDDSSGESDVLRQERASDVQTNVASASSNGKPPISSLPKSKGPRQIHRTINKAVPKNFSFSRAFRGAANSRAARTSSVDQQSAYRTSSALKRNLGKQELCSDHTVGLNKHGLEDLRQQIQLRESKLKHVAAQPNKDTAIQNIDAARDSNAVSADLTLIEPKDPVRKRMKVSRSYPTLPVIDGRLRASATVALEDLTLQKGGLQDGTKADHGADVDLSCNQTGKNYNKVDPHSIPRQTAKGHISLSSLQKSKPSQNNSSLWNLFGNSSVSGHSHGGIQALLDLEESFDKELEEAQEYRHICEIEERNALKAYRKAQRSLIEANARCAELCRRREMCSANIGSLIMDDSSLLCFPRRHENARTGFGTSNNISENMDRVPKLNPIQLNHGDPGQREYNQNIDSAIGHSRYVPYPLSEQNMGSETCSEPDASTSDRLPGKCVRAASRPRSPSCHPNVSPNVDDDETFPVDHESTQHNFEGPRKEENFGRTQGGIVTKLNKAVPAVSVQDSLLLEAALRSELFARLGMRTAVKDGGSCCKTEAVIDRGAESDFASEKTQMNDGTSRLERSISEGLALSEEKCRAKENSSNVHSTADLEPNEFTLGGDFSSTSTVFSAPLFLRSTFGHLKTKTPPIILLESETRLQNKSYSLHNDETQQSRLVEPLICEREIGSTTCDFKVDPFWPLCMYELRGRCNNHECPWQHFKDLSRVNIHEDQHDNSVRADSQLGLTLYRKTSNVEARTRFHNALSLPTYHVCLDTMRACSNAYESVVAQHGQSWWKYFSIFMALSNLLLKDLNADGRLLHGSKGRIEVYESWRTQSSYFGSKSSMMNQLKQGSDAAVQSVEMALLTLSQAVNKLEGITKALEVLSRSLEADPTSEIVWVVYLLIYCSNTKSVGKDDMFSYAVKHNQGSYGLWLVYINSRRLLIDQLDAYDAALRGLCSHASMTEIDRTYASASILDLFLQMIDCLCMSGNAAKAIHRICRLLPAAEISDDPRVSVVSDILTCLTFSDKCVFWVCCVYLIIYRKLPDGVIQGLELQKELVSIEWPSVDLIGDEKQRALKLLETGVQSVELSSNYGSLGSGTNLQSAHHFALSHVRCMIALNDLECCWNLLEKYVKLYPSCFELKLLAASLHQNDVRNVGFTGFEEILSNWPKEAPGIQCVWNQYAEYALRCGRHEFLKELMSCWYRSVWNVLSPRSETMSVVHGDAHVLLESALSNPDIVANQLDMVFGFLNLSLHSLLLSSHIEARLAINRALKAAAPEHLMHCIKEHATFVFNDESRTKGGFPVSLQLSLLKSYLDHARSFPMKVPLSLKFINDIEKPRVRQLVSNLLTPISSEFSLVNIVLEAWYGPSLVPQKLSKQSDLVDFVEAVLDVVPSNYPLTLSICKQLSREHSHTDGSRSIMFWASSNLVNTISCAIPIPPEYAWVEAADMLSSIAGIEAIAESFFKKALSVYPFSLKLWKYFYSLSKAKGDTKAVVEAAREKGIEIV